ncbi:class III lanthionine synthetase LanKC [Streptomyces niveiscabiei]|uniref:class III lanthionine synthetase LanKC n=1 Tax=Streptomyces niveiscabiei TaxID=164115 RepID=UPI0029ADE2C6|nr:class III lanthionine synthetase LanKC [Streptomyces niveiscabiei]MDX3387414.1 class III lanthionine synthetase LanKC [Streptomyces niveiscabiei]
MDAYRRVMFLAPGTPFFDRTEADASDPDDDFLALHASEPPADWSCHTGTDWTMLTPHGYQLPAQGWKVHVSATSENARTVLDRSWAWLVEQRMAFKFIRSRQVLLRRNGKYGDRGASGKFITVYPEDETRLASVLAELGDLLDGERGPYILSDLRWRSGPLYVRYGGFVARVMKTAKGDTVPCIEDPDGNLVPDVRGPSFRPPEWVTIPDCLAPALEARNAGTLHDFPYRPERALHFSNGGGVYRGTDTRTGEPVLLREARPLAGIDTHGEDAVARLQRERDCLERLAGLPWVPRLIEARVGHEHHFLVREFVEGETLAIRTTRDNPASPSADPARTAEYTRWAVDVLDQIDQGVQAMHARGVVFGDLHPGNIMVRPDDSIAFIDLETATTDLTSRQIHAAPGFAAPPTHRGPSIDRYALGCLRIALFLPLTSLLAWGPEKLDHLIELIETRYPVPADFGAKVRADLGAGVQDQDVTPVERPTSSVASGILATATPAREDRLYPGDTSQFLLPEGGTCLAYGAAGVLWALSETGTEVPAAHVDWLAEAARRTVHPAPGLYTGTSGVACVLQHLGRTDSAAALLEGVGEPVNDTLLDGRAGLGLAQLYFARATGDDAALKQATLHAERLVESAADRPPRRGEAGLLRGRAGTALLLLRLHALTPDTALLDAAHDLLDADLRALGWTDDGWTPGSAGTRPTFAAGSGGTALVLKEYLGQRPDPQYESACDTVLRSALDCVPHTVGLFHGFAGVLLAATRLGGPTDARHLRLYEVPHEGAPAFLGLENVRLTTDLATGAAGVLLARNTSTPLAFL